MFRPPAEVDKASLKDLIGDGEPIPKSEGGTKKFLQLQSGQRNVLGIKSDVVLLCNDEHEDDRCKKGPG